MYTPFKMKGKSPLAKSMISAVKMKTPMKQLGDLNKDGKMSGYETARQTAINKNTPAKKMKVKDMPRKQQMAVKASMAEQSPAKMKKESSMKMMKKK